jgi:hypothetical protein
LVEWRLLHAGAYTPWRVVVDFRTTEPPPRDFWSVYAPGTYQNRFGTPGRYLFRLDLNPARLQPGHYQLEVQVADIRDNHSTAAWSLQIASGARVTPSALPLPAPQPFRPGQINRYLKETPRPLHSDRTPAGR